MHDQQVRNSQHKKNNLIMWIFLGIILYFLITEHWAHIMPYLPWLLLAACPLLHMFMHGRHNHGPGQDTHESNDTRNSHSRHEEK